MNIYACRDLDSRISAREVAAVQEFVQSDKLLHSMRDPPGHGVEFVGAAWGADLSKPGARDLWWKAWVRMFKDKKRIGAPRSSWGPDQGLLKLHVWEVFEVKATLEFFISN